MISVRVSIDPRAMRRAVRKLSTAKVAEIVRKTVDADARGLIKDVISITPPMVGGRSFTESRQAGNKSVSRDIKRVFASASYTYETIRRRSPAAASAFWFSKNKKNDVAARIVRDYSDNPLLHGKPLLPAPDPAMHQNARSRRGRVESARSLAAVITRDPALKRYITSVQRRVGLLASGWLPSANHYQVKVPSWVPGSSTGAISFRNNGPRYTVSMINANKHATAELERRVNTVAGWNKRQKRIDIRFRAELTAALRAAVA